VAVREQEHVAPGRHRPRDDPLGAARHRLDRLAARHPAAPDRPALPLAPDLGGGAPLVRAVVPLDEIVVGLRLGSVSGQPAGLAGARERAREHQREGSAAQHPAQGRRRSRARLGEREVGAARVSPGAAPLGLAVADDPDLAGRVLHRRDDSTGTRVGHQAGWNRRMPLDLSPDAFLDLSDRVARLADDLRPGGGPRAGVREPARPARAFHGRRRRAVVTSTRTASPEEARKCSSRSRRSRST